MAVIASQLREAVVPPSSAAVWECRKLSIHFRAFVQSIERIRNGTRDEFCDFSRSDDACEPDCARCPISILKNAMMAAKHLPSSSFLTLLLLVLAGRRSPLASGRQGRSHQSATGRGEDALQDAASISLHSLTTTNLSAKVSQNLQKLTNPLGGGGGGSSAFTKASAMVQDRLESKQHLFSYEDSEPDVDDVEDDTFLDSKIIKLSAEYGINEGTRTERLAMFKQNPSAAIKQIKPLWPYGTAPPPLPSEHPVWWSEILPSRRVPPRRRIFCNRSLNMRNIKAIGFDME